MNLYLKFENNDWYDFGTDDLSSVILIKNERVKIKKWMNEALESISRLSAPFGAF